MEYAKLCSLILGIEPQIRSAFVYRSNGEILAGGMRNGVKSLLPIDEVTRSVHSTISRWNSRKSLFPFLGTGKYSITEYEKIKRISFLLNTKAYLIITTEVEVKHDAVIQKILQLLE